MKAARLAPQTNFNTCSACRSIGWQNWIGFEREFQNRNLAEVRARLVITPDHKLVARRTRLGIAS